MQQRFSRHRGGAVAVLLIVAASLLTGCASGFESPVLQPYTPGAGVNDRSGEVYGLNLVVVTTGEGRGTLVATLLNTAEDEDALVEVEVRPEDDRPVEASLAGDVPLPPDVLVQLHEEQAVTLSGAGLQPGLFVGVTLRFRRAAPISIQVPTETTEGPYAEIEVP
ncbi:MAG: hypothetical protein M3P83_07830 [Actinomycetota bacterium]|nr:hypothetical protein [Actinomycetota bacterium]